MDKISKRKGPIFRIDTYNEDYSGIKLEMDSDHIKLESEEDQY